MNEALDAVFDRTTKVDDHDPEPGGTIEPVTTESPDQAAPKDCPELDIARLPN
jgi:hypothetical protein